MAGRRRIIMIGDSLIEWFDWTARFPEHEVHNLGISGETVEWMLDRVPRTVQSYPGAERVFILSGINNLAMEDPGFTGPYAQAVAEFRAAYPGAGIFVISLLPTLLPWIGPGAIEDMNVRLMRMAQEGGAGYIDLHSVFMRHDLREMLSADGIHISPAGYAVFSAEIARYI